MSLASKTPPISHVLYDERSRQVPWSLETGFAKSTGNSWNSPRLGIWLLTSTEEPYPMRLEKNIVVAGGLAGIGWAAARISPAKRSLWTVAARLVKATTGK